MCLIFVSFECTEGFPLVVAANRDEFYDRPASPAGFWSDQPDVLAGRDLVAGGTWLGVSRTRRFAALTNFRSGQPRDPNAPSRGDLVRQFLTGSDSASAYLEDVATRADAYAGFSLLTFSGGELAYFSNRGGPVRALEAGVYGLSNDLLDTPWPKVTQGKASMTRLLGSPDWEAVTLLDLMADRDVPTDSDLPDTGVGLERERMLAPMMVTGDGYGTRCSSVVTVGHDGVLNFTERTYQPPDQPDGLTSTDVSHRLT